MPDRQCAIDLTDDRPTERSRFDLASIAIRRIVEGDAACHVWFVAHRKTRAFSSEVDPGSREENASKQESRAKSERIESIGIPIGLEF
jgi:hypothetical protein